MIILKHKLNAVILLFKTLQWFLHFSYNGIVTHHKARPWPQPCPLSELFAITHYLRGNTILHFLLPLGLGPSSALCLGSSASLQPFTGCLSPSSLLFIRSLFNYLFFHRLSLITDHKKHLWAGHSPSFSTTLTRLSSYLFVGLSA